MALRLKPIDLEAHDATTLVPFMAAARALVEDFEASFEPGAHDDDDLGEGSSRTGWRPSRAGHDSHIQVKTARGRALGPDVRDRLGPDETWIGRISEHGKDEADWDEWQVRSRAVLVLAGPQGCPRSVGQESLT
jgi:hypothetical protein